MAHKPQTSRSAFGEDDGEREEGDSSGTEYENENDEQQLPPVSSGSRTASITNLTAARIGSATELSAAAAATGSGAPLRHGRVDSGLGERERDPLSPASAPTAGVGVGAMPSRPKPAHGLQSLESLRAELQENYANQLVVARGAGVTGSEPTLDATWTLLPPPPPVPKAPPVPAKLVYETAADIDEALYLQPDAVAALLPAQPPAGDDQYVPIQMPMPTQTRLE